MPSSQRDLSESPHAVKTSWLTFTTVHLLSFTPLTGNFLSSAQSIIYVSHIFNNLYSCLIHLLHREHSNFVNCIRYSPDGTKFITVSSDKKGMIYDGKTGDKIGELASEDGHKGSIYAVSWSPDSKRVMLLGMSTCYQAMQCY